MFKTSRREYVTFFEYKLFHDFYLYEYLWSNKYWSYEIVYMTCWTFCPSLFYTQFVEEWHSYQLIMCVIWVEVLVMLFSMSGLWQMPDKDTVTLMVFLDGVFIFLFINLQQMCMWYELCQKTKEMTRYITCINIVVQ